MAIFEVNPDWFETVEENIDKVDTCKEYEAAWLATLQIKYNDNGWFKVLSNGEANTGMSGNCGTVVKFHMPDQLLVPAEDVAFTCQ